MEDIFKQKLIDRFESWWQSEGKQSYYFLPWPTARVSKATAKDAWLNGAYVQREICNCEEE